MRKKNNASEKVKPIRRQKTITARLLSSIALIFFIAVSVITLAYNALPEWVYYLNPATRLYFAADEIANAYGTDYFTDTLRDIEKGYDSNIEIYAADDRFIYSTLDPDRMSLPLKISSANTVDSKYKLTYSTSQGAVSTGDRGFLIKTYDGGNIDVDFLVCYFHLPEGERIEVCMQVSQVISTTKIDFIVAFGFFMSSLSIGFFILILYLRKFSKPIDNMCEITGRMAKLDFSKKCPPTKLIEMTQLSQSINTLSDALDEALSDLSEKNAKLLKDIENERTIDNLRQTFISGISHELKTPIAIIQGYAEGAKMFYEAGNGKAASEYCDVISDETVRMNNMIMRLLEITKYSSGAYEPVRENFSIRDMVRDWYEKNSALFEEKGITSENDINPEYIGNGDSIILYSVINNYLSNAVSHIGGDRKILCRAEVLGDRYRVYVFNTGEHIEEKHIDKIWDSFYRADKALSRSQGRFGLGLAIVASIQKLHNQDYGVRNVPGGVEFWFDIKKSVLL
ncbi:MAG: HAMP domain-containing histidine kinase [Clostridia bacterium]|nr:HAMP domain-containing histidine kinase [Clostridia bacterium]